MWHSQRLTLAVVTIALVAASCAPRDQVVGSQGDGATVAPRQPKSITFAVDHEPEVIVTALGSRTSSELRNSLHAHLATYDPSSAVRPQLALDLPSEERGTWVVRPDGTMQTTYHFYPNVTWHDGVPLTAQDFVFAWTVVMDPALPIESRDAARSIARIDTPDDHTLVIEWSRLYGLANAIVNDDIGPMPEHLLKDAYASGNMEQFWALPYWTREFVGVGPYRILRWEPGSQIDLQAYAGYFAGKPKIDNVTIRFIPSVDTIVANLLAGSVDAAGAGFVKIDQLSLVQQQWEQAGQTPTAIVQLGSWRLTWIQHRSPSFPELLDPRVRQGLVMALDRDAMAASLTSGKGQAADTFIPPDDERWDWVKNVAVHYPHDLARAEQRFADAGLRRGSDRVFMNSAGARMVLGQWANAGTENEQEVAIAADQWKTFGILTEPMILSRTQFNDSQYRVSFPALYHTSVPRLVEIPDTRFASANCPSETNRWAGQNYGCYRSAAADLILAGLKGALSPGEQEPLYQALIKHYTEELPMLPLYFQADMVLVRQGVTGVTGSARPYGGYTWNIADWDMR